MLATCDEMFVWGIHCRRFVLEFQAPQLYTIASFPEEENLSHAEKQRVWSRRCGFQKLLQYTDRAPLWLLETKLLASAGWKRGCEHFGCRCSQHVTTCYFRNPFPPFLFGIPSLRSVPEAGGSWERQHAPSAWHYGCIMIIPWLQQHLLCREAKGLVTALSCPRFVTYNTVIDCVKDLDYRISIVLSVVTRDCCKPMTTCQDWVLSNSELEVGPPAFELPSLKTSSMPKRVLFDMFV